MHKKLESIFLIVKCVKVKRNFDSESAASSLYSNYLCVYIFLKAIAMCFFSSLHFKFMPPVDRRSCDLRNKGESFYRTVRNSSTYNERSFVFMELIPNQAENDPNFHYVISKCNDRSETALRHISPLYCTKAAPYRSRPNLMRITGNVTYTAAHRLTLLRSLAQ